jgi:tripartite-type tricarboxylate transporter receptor subunit TctC
MAAKRAAVVAQLATSGEQGLAGVEASVWNAFFLPKGTPEPIVRRLNGAMNDMLENPSLRKRLEDLGLEIVAPERRSPEYLAKFVREEVERWGRLIKAAGISAD